MSDPQAPLSPEETAELAELLDRVAGRTLAFARGVFAAATTAPTLLEPTQWLGLLLAQAPPDRTSLLRLMSLTIREYNACAECLSLGVPAVPASDDAEGVEQFCKGYIRVSQGDRRWTSDPTAFSLTVPFAWMAGYVDAGALASFAPEALDAPEEFRRSRMQSLPDDVAELFRYWEKAREQPPVAAAPRQRIGRNEPCPCGSGRKYKRCCGAA